jgi:methionyl-tRNA synthetase
MVPRVISFLHHGLFIFKKEGFKMEKYYISTAIAYASGKPHIGNTYEIVLADAIARNKRLEGYDVYLQTGTDEHGEKIELKAKDKGITPQQYVDEASSEIKRIWDLMNTSYDKFVRTTDKRHEEVVQHIFKYMYDKGDIYLGKYEGWYCTPDESFWTDSQVVKNEDGTVLCPDCGRPVEKKDEEAYFFRLSKYQKQLEDYIESHPEFIQPVSRKNEMLNNFIKPGLQDLCVSRTAFSWGIPVDFDPKHVVYVWLDALTNYITNIGYDVNGGNEEFGKWWPADLHLIGKDIIRFHTIYWPCFLMSLDIPMPKKVFGHPWLVMADGKMSKSVGNVVYADDLVEKYGVDAVRYYFLHEIPFANDGIFTEDLLVERINGDLANILGNLVNRTISMSNKYFDGEVVQTGVTDTIDQGLKDLVTSLGDKVKAHMDELKVSEAIDDIFEVLRASNKYIDETMPWALAKEEDKQDRLKEVLYNLLESIRVCAVYLQAFLPETSEKIFKQINTDLTTYESTKEFGGYVSGNKVGTPEILFARIDTKKDNN